MKALLKSFLLLMSVFFPSLAVFSASVASSPKDDEITDSKYIGKHYWEGIVKIMVYDPVIEQLFHLKKGDGYLTRGSGFFVTPDGVIFTNRHVVEWSVYGYAVADWVDAEGTLRPSDVLTYTPGLEHRPEIKKIYYVGHAIPYVQVFKDEEGRTYDLYKAEVVSIGEGFDGAMLRIVSTKEGHPVKHLFKPLPIGNSDKVELGEDLVVLGFPSQYQKSDFYTDLKDTLTMSFGKHSGWDYVFDDVYGFIKTNAAVHEGNSGGPVFGDDEKVMGIATAMGIRTQIGLVEGINGMYYVAAHDKQILAELVKRGLAAPKDSRRYAAASGKPRQLPQLAALKDLNTPRQFLSFSNRSALLSGVVAQSGAGELLADASIKVWSVDKNGRKIAELASTYSNSKGEFIFPQALQLNKTYKLVVAKQGYKTLEQDLQLVSASSNAFQIHLEKSK